MERAEMPGAQPRSIAEALIAAMPIVAFPEWLMEQVPKIDIERAINAAMPKLDFPESVRAPIPKFDIERAINAAMPKFDLVASMPHIEETLLTAANAFANSPHWTVLPESSANKIAKSLAGTFDLMAREADWGKLLPAATQLATLTAPLKSLQFTIPQPSISVARSIIAELALSTPQLASSNAMIDEALRALEQEDTRGISTPEFELSDTNWPGASEAAPDTEDRWTTFLIAFCAVYPQLAAAETAARHVWNRVAADGQALANDVATRLAAVAAAGTIAAAGRGPLVVALFVYLLLAYAHDPEKSQD